MDPIRSLQSRALVKRNTAIAEARRTYKADIEAISALDRRLPAPVVIDRNQPLAKAPTAVDYIKQVAPQVPFTVSTIIDLLIEAHPGEKFHLPSIRSYVSRLCSRGYFRRLRKTGQMETLYVRPEVTEDAGGIETKNMATVAAEILAAEGRPLTPMEIGVLMHQRGYRADNSPITIVRAVRDMFKRYPGRFERGKDGRWEAAQLHEH